MLKNVITFILNFKIFLFFSLEEGGATALGPALYYSILIASRKKGSQVILWFDFFFLNTIFPNKIII